MRLGDCLPPEHLARFVVDAIAQMDLSGIYARYGTRGGEAYAPDILVGLLFYGYATGVFSTRKIERATFESIPFRYIAGDRHPDHDTIASFRKTFLPEIKELFVQLLVLAHLAEVLAVGAISADGTKLHADASKSQAVSYKRLGEIEAQLGAEVEELFALSEQVEQQEVPAGLVVGDEIARRAAYLARLATAKAVLEARAAERLAQEQAAYEAKVAQRAEKERSSGRRPGGRPPSPPTPGPRATDQYNFTDPDSRIMKTRPTPALSRTTMSNARWTRPACSSWAPRSPTTPTTARKPRRCWRRSRRRWARPRRWPWTRAIAARRPWRPVPAAASSPTSRRGAIRITPVGRSASPHRLLRPRRTPAHRGRWPTNSRPPWAKSSTARANVPLSRSSGSSKRCWASGSSRCVAWKRLPGNGAWSAWPSISSAYIPCPRSSKEERCPASTVRGGYRRPCPACGHTSIMRGCSLCASRDSGTPSHKPLHRSLRQTAERHSSNPAPKNQATRER